MRDSLTSTTKQGGGEEAQRVEEERGGETESDGRQRHWKLEKDQSQSQRSTWCNETQIYATHKAK